MNKKLTVSLLLAALLVGCQNNNSSTNSTNNSTTSSSTTSSEVSSTTSNHSTITSSSSSTSSSVSTSSSSSSSTDRVYSSSVDVDEDKYPYIASMGVDRTKPHNAYQVLVYSFFDSDGDGYGDLKGVEQKLDYIQGLGSDIIWLSPIMPAESYHAYDVVSFYDIDERIGTIDDYLSLVNEAHRRDMKILLDMPINHTSVNHEWFKGYLSGDEKYAEYYQEKDTSVINGNSSSMGSTARFYVDAATRKTYYASFGQTMPDLNFQSEVVVDAIKRVFEYWVGLGADGFRFDAVKHIFDPNEIPMELDETGKDVTWDKSVAMNNALFKDLGDHLKTISPDLYLLGENYSGQYEVKQYAESFDAEFDFDAWHMSLGAVTNNDPWGSQSPRTYYDDTIVGNTNELISLNAEWIPTFMTGNHDVTRAASYIGDKVTDDDAAFKLYASMLMLRSGIPFIYYGDELGMYGENKSGDNFVEDAEIRLPMQFNDSTIDLETMFYSTVVNKTTGEESNLGANVLKDWPNYKDDNPKVDESIADPDSLYNTYKSLIAFRSAHSAIYAGTMSKVSDVGSNATIYKMESADETLYVALNFNQSDLTIENVTTESLEVIYNVNGATSEGTNISLPGRGVAVFTITGEFNSSFSYSSTGNGGGGSGNISGEAPATGYALIVTPGNGGDSYYVPLTAAEEFEGFQQYFGDNVSFSEGDTFILYNCDAKESWVEDNLNPYSIEGCFEATANGVRCKVSGTYDIYVKFKWEADEIYIGPSN